MKAGLTASIIGHLAILGLGFVAFDATPLEAEAVEALPVELVTIAEVTDLLKGDNQAEELPEEIQPTPDVEAEAPAPEPAEEPVEEPVEAAQEPIAPPPPPEPEPEPEPEAEPEPEETAAIPEPPAPEPEPLAEPEPLPEPEPAAPLEPRIPKARPTPPPQPIAEPEPDEPEREIADLIPVEPPQETEQQFDPNDIAALLNKQDPAGGGAPTPAETPQTLGSSTGNVTAEMTQSWIAALTSKLAACWRPPVGVREAQNLRVTVVFQLMSDGNLIATPTLASAAFDQLSQVAAETAVRAVVECAPYGDIFPPEHYEIWGQPITVDFDPREMFGAG